MTKINSLPYGLTFDDVLLVPQYSSVLPNETRIQTRFSRNIQLNTPLSSAAMDTVTEAQTAISMAQGGGIGVIHKNMTIQEQVTEVQTVKRSESGMITHPITITSSQSIAQAVDVMTKYKISGLPVIDDGILVGILTGRDIRFEKNMDKKVSELMTQKVITVEEPTSLEQAVEIMHSHKIEKLPVLARDKKRLVGLYTTRDVKKTKEHPFSVKDSKGRLRVGAAVGASGPFLERCEALLAADVDVLVLDTAHGFSQGVIKGLQAIKENFAKRYDFDVVGGNVATKEGAEALIKAGADGVKVGMGPGSICTTRIIAGVGVPQLTAIMDCREKTRQYGVPLIADGGMRFSGDIAKALAAGADSVMCGGIFAGTKEAPGETIIYQGKTYKTYRGMGSLGAMSRGSKDRYFQEDVKDGEKLVPEGIEGRVAYKGALSESLYQITGGIRAMMGYLGAIDLEDLREKAQFLQITPASLKESHAHDVLVTHEAPNYKN